MGGKQGEGKREEETKAGIQLLDLLCCSFIYFLIGFYSKKGSMVVTTAAAKPAILLGMESGSGGG